MYQSVHVFLTETEIPTSPTSEGITPSGGGLSDRERTIAIAVPTAVVGAILLLVVIILIIMIAVHCRKKRHSQKYVLNYHTVYGKNVRIEYLDVCICTTLNDSLIAIC